MNYGGKVSTTTIQAIGSKIRKERTSQSLTQTELGDLSGVSINFISQLEQGKETVQMNRVLMVLETLGLTLKVEYNKTAGHQ